MKLPIAFETKMKKLLQGEYESYLASYDSPKYQGIRVNTSKVSLMDWSYINPFREHTKEVPWCEEGFYYTDEQPSKHPYYFAGLYYIQEPSAMSAAAYIPIEEGDKVLDLCAAPGGKSTQVAAKLNGTGVLVANDISATRTKALVKNLENFGVSIMIVCNEEPGRLSQKWEGYFDKILVDAPCSGEGMFRKDENAIKSWETHGVEYCSALQKDILIAAAKMLRVSGMILYSTCTFSPEENEAMIDQFLKEHPEFRVVPLDPVGGIQQAHPEWVDADESIRGALRLWPHHIKGEGHFLCLLQKISGENKSCNLIKPTQKIKDISELKDFIEAETYLDVKLSILQIKDKVYLVNEDMPTLDGLRIVRSGLLLGTLKNKRFEPSHALALAFSKKMFKHTLSLAADSPDVIKYLKGETLLYDAQKGYHVLCIEDYPLGWVKAQNKLLKNQYPPAWRMMG